MILLLARVLIFIGLRRLARWLLEPAPFDIRRSLLLDRANDQGGSHESR